ncbi:MAG TPA: hypothetical protein VLK79_07420 [Gaiellales bacterium]|nr:hypothetical protein [Gaiellales bacterium]
MRTARLGRMRARRLVGLCLAILLSAVLVVGCGGGGGGSFTLPSNATLPTGGGGGGGGGQTTTETVSPPPQTQHTNANNEGESTNWALIALIAGAVVLVALIGWLIARSRGARGRYSRAVNDIYAEGVTVHDRLATLGPQPGAAVAGVDPMLDKLTADARRLQPSAPNDHARAALEDLLRDLVAIRSAVSAIETTGAAAETVDLPGRLASMRASLDRVLATR